MPWFRYPNNSAPAVSAPPTLDDVRSLIADAVRPGHFFVGPATRLEWDHVVAEEISWEVFRGRLLDPAHTRQRRTFEAWNVYLIENGTRPPEPLLSAKLDAAAGQVHVVRAIHCYAWEAYDAGDNVILSREAKKWVRELVGTLDLADFTGAEAFRDELAYRIFQAVVGTSRLPLTSVEAPLPAFTFGELAYFDYFHLAAGAGPMRSFRELLEAFPPRVKGDIGRVFGKFFEAVLLAMPIAELPEAVELLAQRFPPRPGESQSFVPVVVRVLFNEVSLSPWTDLPEKALTLASRLAARVGRHAEMADLLGQLLRQTGRHLTAYDLVRFHHAGANFPDALLLDVVLRSYLEMIEHAPPLFLDEAGDDEPTRKAKRLRRRGLRQAWLIRQLYQGHPVPDAPTSPGENARVLPAPHVRVPEEQILNPHQRAKRLFADDMPGGGFGPSARAVLRESVRDLAHPAELRELGAALYLDRPLGAFKAPGEPDQTIMLSYEAFSRAIAMQRLLLLARDATLLPDDELTACRQSLQALAVSGVPLSGVVSNQRPGVVSLGDAGKAADDFVFVRTTVSSLSDFFWLFDFAPLAERFGMRDLTTGPWLLLGGPSGGEVILTLYEVGTLRRRLELSADPRDGYVCRAGTEYPRKGLRVRRVWEEVGGELREHDLSGEELFVRPR